MPETRVIHVRDADFSDSNTVYIGRKLLRYGFWQDSPWANPFRKEMADVDLG